jgi:hypothetical protein
MSKSKRQPTARGIAVKKWKMHHAGYTVAELNALYTGFNAGWNAHTKKVIAATKKVR